MPNLNCNASYDQIPHIVINHPDTTLEHWGIMCVLYKVLKDKYKIIYTNESLAKACRVSVKTIERRLSELRKMGFIVCTGRGLNRRISLGTSLTGEG
jgi:DNA-binding MarR family transcriptional regulator